MTFSSLPQEIDISFSLFSPATSTPFYKEVDAESAISVSMVIIHSQKFVLS